MGSKESAELRHRTIGSDVYGIDTQAAKQQLVWYSARYESF